MDEKNTRPSLQFRRPSSPFAMARQLLLVLVLLCLGYNIWHSNASGSLSRSTNTINTINTVDNNDNNDNNDNQASSAKALVPLEAHIISKCPDTRDALKLLILPAMQRVHDKVNFTLSYIGTPTADDGVQCKHGPSECLGNIIELCARHLYPNPKISLGFVNCLTQDYSHIPERSLVEDCALEHAIDFQKLNECATRDDGAYGVGLLRRSVERTAKAGVSISCTLRLNHQTYCIRDAGQWIDCPHGPGVNDLVLAIEKLHHSLLS